MNQSTLSGLIRKPYRWSPFLPQIARALQTTVEYLVGETDDAEDNAPRTPATTPPSPTIHHVMMAVALPEERALIRMFEALLRTMPGGAGLEEQAELLAKRLPIALAQLNDLLPPDRAQAVQAPADPERRFEAFAIPDHERRQ